VNPEQFVSYAEGWYDGSILGMDAEIGRLMEYLRNNKMDSKTLLVVMGDHGEEFLDHDKMFHGHSVYGELTGVPLIMRRTGALSANAKIKDTIESVDLMPTILEIVGLHAPKNIQGKSFVSLLRSANSKGSAEAAPTSNWNRPAFSMKAATHDNASPPPLLTESFAVVSGNWKLIHNTIPDEGVPEYELFDFYADPLNKKNVAEQNPEIVTRLSKLIEDWRVNAAKGKLKPDSEAAKGLSQEELERLRSLGYIQ
jgi:choline-sulfatase